MYILDVIAVVLKGIFITLAVLIGLGLLILVGAQVAENWDAEEYPYSGFQPDCPTWDEPVDERYLPRPVEDEEEE